MGWSLACGCAASLGAAYLIFCRDAAAAEPANAVFVVERTYDVTTIPDACDPYDKHDACNPNLSHGGLCPQQANAAPFVNGDGVVRFMPNASLGEACMRNSGTFAFCGYAALRSDGLPDDPVCSLTGEAVRYSPAEAGPLHAYVWAYPSGFNCFNSSKQARGFPWPPCLAALALPLILPSGRLPRPPPRPPRPASTCLDLAP